MDIIVKNRYLNGICVEFVDLECNVIFLICLYYWI